MRTSKLWMSVIALGLVTFWAEPASAGEGDLTANTATAVALNMNNSANATHGQIALAGMLAVLTAMLVLRRRSRE